MEHGFQGKEGQIMPIMPDAFIEEVSERYIELYERITGLTFERTDTTAIDQRIERNVLAYLKAS